MGTLSYGEPGRSIEIDDRVLAHVKLVIVAKLRRNESFCLSWEHDQGVGGRSTVWLHPTIPLRFRFHGSREPELNREWLEELMIAANSSGGMKITTEPARGAFARVAVPVAGFG